MIVQICPDKDAACNELPISSRCTTCPTLRKVSTTKGNKMTDSDSQNYYGMRAMSQEQMKAMQLAQADGMRNVYPSNGGMAAMQNQWSGAMGDRQPETTPLPRWQRLCNWMRAL